jgi:hypothetical protein
MTDYKKIRGLQSSHLTTATAVSQGVRGAPVIIRRVDPMEESEPHRIYAGPQLQKK